MDVNEMFNLHPLKSSLNLVQVFWQQPVGIFCSNFAVWMVVGMKGVVAVLFLVVQTSMSMVIN